MAVNESKRSDPREWERWRRAGALDSVTDSVKTSDTGDNLFPFPNLVQGEHPQEPAVAEAGKQEQPYPWRKRIKYSILTSVPVAVLGDMLWDARVPDSEFGRDFPYGYAGAVVGASTARLSSQEQTKVFDRSLLDNAKCTARSVAPVIASGIGAYTFSGGSVRDAALNILSAVAGRITAHGLNKTLMEE